MLQPGLFLVFTQSVFEFILGFGVKVLINSIRSTLHYNLIDVKILYRGILSQTISKPSAVLKISLFPQETGSISNVNPEKVCLGG